MTKSHQSRFWLQNPELHFANRTAAGQALAAQLTAYANRQDVLVLALPRGGVPVAFEIAHALAAPLDLLLVRKLGVPGQEELALGAITEGGLRVLNTAVVDELQIRPEVIDRVTADEVSELARRAQVYRGGRPPPDLQGRTLILVDDGLATGATMRVAVAAVRAQNPARVVVAAPVAARSTANQFRQIVDDLVVVATPSPFGAIGLWYENFSQLSDAQVQALLAQAEAFSGAGSHDNR